MPESAVWFVGLLIASGGAFFLGRWSSRRLGLSGRVLAGVALVVLLAWGWLQHNPVWLVRLLPLGILSYLEGTGGAPLFALILGIAWSRSRLARERKVVLLGMAIGALYFLHGGLWMVQTTPASVLATSNSGKPIVMQSQDFTCGPASCATALRLLGVPTSESEMALYTQTRPGTGTTMIRALDGLTRRLEGTPWRVDLVQPGWDDLPHMHLPALVQMRFGFSEDHMVTLLRARANIIQIADPVDGKIYLTRSHFERVYTGEMLVFSPRSPLAER